MYPGHEISGKWRIQEYLWREPDTIMLRCERLIR